MTNTTVRQQMSVALVLDEEELRTLHNLLRSITPSIRIEATVRDGIVHEFKNIDDFLGLPNSAEESVVELSWTGRDPKSSRHTDVSISSSTEFSHNVSFSFESPDANQVREAARTMRTWVRENRPAYGWIAERDWLLTIAGAWWCLLYGFSLWLKLTKPSTTQEANTPASPFEAIVVIALFVSPLVIGWLFEKIKPSIFPVLAIQIGHGKKRFQRASTMRVAVLLSLIVGVLSSIIATIITR